MIGHYFLLSSIFREWTRCLWEESFRDTTVKNLFIIRYKWSVMLISEFAKISFGSIFREWTLAVYERSLRSKIYPSFDINDDRPCLFPNLPTYVRSFEKRSQWYYFVSNSRDITSFVIRQNTNRASRYSALDVIKIFRARMKSYRSTWFVILVARYRVTIAKLHSLSDPLPSARTFLPAIYHRESCRVGFLRLWSNR